MFMREKDTERVSECVSVYVREADGRRRSDRDREGESECVSDW